MADARQDVLEQAYQFIRQERFAEARELLQPILHDSADTDAWWLWANAVSEPGTARDALGKVLELDPGHEQARQFLSRLDALYPFGPAVDISEAVPEVRPTEQIGVTTDERDQTQFMPAEVTFDEEPEIHEFDYAVSAQRDEEAEEDFVDWPVDEPSPEVQQEPAMPLSRVVESPGKSRRPILRNTLVALALVAIAVIVAVAVLNSRQGIPAPAATPQLSVLEPSQTLQLVLEAAQTGVSAAGDVLGGESEAQLVMYNEAPALMIRVCRGAGADLAGALREAMALSARYGISAQDELGHVGAMIVNCARNDMLVEAIAPIADAAAYAGGMQDLSAFQAGWILSN